VQEIDLKFRVKHRLLFRSLAFLDHSCLDIGHSWVFGSLGIWSFSHPSTVHEQPIDSLPAAMEFLRSYANLALKQKRENNRGNITGATLQRIRMSARLA